MRTHEPPATATRNPSRATLAVVLLAACYAGSSDAGTDAAETGSTSGPATTNPATMTTGVSVTTASSASTSVDSSESTAAMTTGSTGDEASTGVVPDVGGLPDDPCATSPTAFCERFDDYTEVALADQQAFGPWRAALSPGGATMDLDGTHTVSGDRALHVRLEAGETPGGRLFTNGDVPLLGDTPTHVWGRMMMYIDQSGTSVHWTFFGVQGPVEPSAPGPGDYASYIMSSLPRDGVNTYSFVDGLSGGPDFQDCWAQGMEPMPTGQWTCVSFEMDSVERRLRMSIDGGDAPIVSVDNTGQGCVDPVPGDSLWYGPEIEQLFVGGWSFHPMNAPLELWIDDLVVDTSPVACP